MPLVSMDTAEYRSPQRLNRQGRIKPAATEHDDGGPRPVGMLGGGRGGSLIAFSEASAAVRQ